MTDNSRKDFNKLASELDYIQDFPEANRVIENFAMHLSKPHPSDYRKFAVVIGKLAPQSNAIAFNSLDIILLRQGFFLPNELDLFDKTEKKPTRLDVTLLRDFITNIAQFDHNKPIAPDFTARFQKYILTKVQFYDLNRQDLAQLSSYFSGNACQNPQIAEIFKQMPAQIEATHRKKLNHEIASLNKWAFGFPDLKNDDTDLLKKLSFRSAYINLLYRRLIQEHTIRNISPQQFYQRHRLQSSIRVKNLIGTCDDNGRQICRKYAINKVYKAEANSDNFKIDILQKALIPYKDYPFYQSCRNILSAIYGGEKYRQVQSPMRPETYTQLSIF